MFKHSTINLRELQKKLFSVAYKMIGEVAASEDIAQDTMAIYLSKSQKNELAEVVNLEKYLAKTAANRSINYLKKIQKERENYTGVWLPEPIFNDGENIDFQIDVDYGVTFLLTRLKPKERAIFILKNAFDFTFKEIGEAIQLKEATCRKSFHRLQDKLKRSPNESTIDKTVKERLIKGFLAVGEENGLEQFIRILNEDITIYSDGGGKKAAATKPLHGISICSKFILGLFQKQGGTWMMEAITVNGEPALALKTLDGQIDTIAIYGIVDYQINRLFLVRNPDKLGERYPG